MGLLRAFFLSFLLLGCTIHSFAKTENWVEVRTPHFTIVCNASEKESRRIADQFERMRSVFHRGFPTVNVDSDAPIIVLAVRDKKDFQALEPEAYLAKGQLELAGLFQQATDKNYVLLRLDAEGDHPFATIYHEYTHFLVRGAAEWLPLWLNEGMAEFYQNTEIENKQVGMGQASPDDIQWLRQNRLLPLNVLLTVDHNSPYYHQENKGSIFYAESWALTHYLFMRDVQNKTDHIQQYARLVQKNVDSVTAATQAFGDLKELQKALEGYIHQGSYYYLKLPGATDVDESTFKARPLSQTEADAVRADFLAYDGRAKDSRALLDRVLQQDPKNVSARETMGYLAFRAGNMQDAQKWYGEAVSLDSQSYLANYYYGAMAMRDNPSAEESARIESSLRAAIKLNPTFAPAFDCLAIYLMSHRKDSQEAFKYAVEAVKLDPGNLNYRLNAANVLLRNQDTKNALTILEGARKVTKTPEEAELVESRMNMVQQYQSARAANSQRAQEFSETQAPEENVTAEAEPVSAPAPEPPDAPHGPRRSVKGVLRDIQCSYPAVMKLTVEGKPIDLRSRNYYKIEYSAVNFTPTGEMNPCKDLIGMQAKVDYFENASDAAKGQIIAIQVTK